MVKNTFELYSSVFALRLLSTTLLSDIYYSILLPILQPSSITLPPSNILPSKQPTNNQSFYTFIMFLPSVLKKTSYTLFIGNTMCCDRYHHNNQTWSRISIELTLIMEPNNTELSCQYIQSWLSLPNIVVIKFL